MMHLPALPPDPCLLIAGGSRGQAIAYARSRELATGSWAWISTSGPISVHVVDESASAEARRAIPLRPSEVLDEHRDAVVEALRELGVLSTAVYGAVARGEDTGESDIELVIQLAEPRPRGFAWAERIAGIETRVYELTGFPCDVIDGEGARAAHLAPDTERVLLFGIS